MRRMIVVNGLVIGVVTVVLGIGLSAAAPAPPEPLPVVPVTCSPTEPIVDETSTWIDSPESDFFATPADALAYYLSVDGIPLDARAFEAVATAPGAQQLAFRVPAGPIVASAELRQLPKGNWVVDSLTACGSLIPGAIADA